MPATQQKSEIINNALMKQYEREGYCIQPGAFSDKECADLIAASKELEDFKAGIFKPPIMPHREHPLFLKALKNPGVVAMIEQMVGGRAVGLQTQFFYCKPGTRGFSNHQDNFYVEAPTGSFASAWCPLVDTYEEKGGLIVYPGTHREGNLPVKKIQMGRDEGQDPNANNEETDIPAQYQPLNAAAPKGSALYIHGQLVHGSNPNKTDEWRYVLLLTYAREGVKFRAGNYAKRAPVDLYS